MGSTPILSVRQPVTIATIKKLNVGDGSECVNRPLRTRNYINTVRTVDINPVQFYVDVTADSCLGGL